MLRWEIHFWRSFLLSELVIDMNKPLPPPAWTKMFPLRLTPFEHYMILDDHPECPMSDVACLVFHGRFDREALQAAFEEAVRYEPAFWMRLRQNGRHFEWILDLENPPPLYFNTSSERLTESDTGEIVPRVMDIRNESGVAFEVVEAPGEEVRIYIYMHHTVGDGSSMVHFMEVWLACYQRRVNPGSELVPVFPEPELYAQREDLHVELPGRVPFYKIVQSVIVETGRWFRRRPWPLEGGREVPADQPQPLPILCWRLMDADLRKAYAAAAKKMEVGMNTLFYRDMFLVLRQWQEEHTQRKPRNAWLRILMPCSMRNEYHEKLPSTNVVGYIFFTRLPEDCTPSHEFLTELHAHSVFAQKWSRGALFINVLKIIEKIPGLLRRITSPKQCHSTLVMSNLGDCRRLFRNPYFQQLGNLNVTGLELRRALAGPPVRSRTPISVGLLTFGADTAVNFMVDRRTFGTDAANEFMNRFFQRMRQSVAEANE